MPLLRGPSTHEYLASEIPILRGTCPFIGLLRWYRTAVKKRKRRLKFWPRHWLLWVKPRPPPTATLKPVLDVALFLNPRPPKPTRSRRSEDYFYKIITISSNNNIPFRYNINIPNIHNKNVNIYCPFNMGFYGIPH